MSNGGIAKFKWNGPALVAYNEKQLKVALDKAWEFFQDKVRKATSRVNT